MTSDRNVPNTSAGKLHLLDLADLKSQIGERWDRMADPMERFFEGAIRRNLGASDTFGRQGELSYIFLFRDLSPEEAQLKCRTIAEEVCERLFGDQIRKASLRALIMPLGLDMAKANAVSAALDELLEVRGKEMIFQATAPRGPIAPREPEPSPDAGITFLYRPIWDATKNVVVTYLCESDDSKYNAPIGSGREQAPPGSPS